MTTRPSRVYADAYTTTAFPQRITGEDDILRVRDAVQMAFLKWRDPWDDDAVVSVGSQVLELTVKGSSAGARTLSARAVATGWTDTGIKDANKPGVTGVTATEDIVALAEGDVVQIDVTTIAQAHAADGGKNRGIRLTTTAAATHEFYSADSPHPPRVVTTWTETPTAPTLTPAGGVVAVPKWAVKFGDLDVDGDLSALQLQVDPAANGTAPAFDTGAQPATVGLLDLATTLYPGLAADAVTQIRGRATIGGVVSDWSPWYTIGHRPQRTLVFDSPAAGIVTSTTPVVLATYNAALTGGEELTSYRLQIFDSTGETLRYDTGRVPATDPNAISEEIPHHWDKRPAERILRKKGGDGYLFVLRAWGDTDRVAAPGAPDCAIATTLVTVDHDALVAAPTALAVAPVGDGMPGLDLTWTISPDAPDRVAVATLDDDIIAVLDAVDVNTGGTSYAWTWTGAPPGEATTVKVAKIVDGKMGPWSTTATGTATPKAFWIVDEELDLKVRLWNVDPEDWEFTDQGAFHDPVGARHLVHVVTSLQGMTGRVVGEIRDEPGLSHDDQVAALHTIKARMERHPNRSVHLVTGRWVIKAQLDNLGDGPSKNNRPTVSRTLVRFAFRQTDYVPGD